MPMEGPPTKVEILDLATGQRRLYREMKPADPSGVLGVGPVCLSPDGEAYLYSFTRSLSDLYLARGLR
jgi:hypothetical protein